MSSGNLIIHPPTDFPPPDPADLVDRLQGLGFAGTPVGESGTEFYAGERFLQLITFLGCSPYVRLEPEQEGDSAFTHLRLLGPFDRPHLIHGRNTRPPGCPHCGKRIADWRQKLESCPACGREVSPGRLYWRQQAAVARLFIVVTDIFPGEAVPLPELLDELGGVGEPWQFCYVQEPALA